jgi:hypothetical protein
MELDNPQTGDITRVRKGYPERVRMMSLSRNPTCKEVDGHETA